MHGRGLGEAGHEGIGGDTMGPDLRGAVSDFVVLSRAPHTEEPGSHRCGRADPRAKEGAAAEGDTALGPQELVWGPQLCPSPGKWVRQRVTPVTWLAPSLPPSCPHRFALDSLIN